jgi:hypothetical protein
LGIVMTVVFKRFYTVAVAGYIDLMISCPHERAYDALWKTGGIFATARLDGRESDIGCYANNTETIDG